ncbi:hypothetical protein HKK52_09120 [Pseudomonas sp. ADAK2]|uniref:hypothetical protein n=1 Tax=unclassified Pseudomonas TaxID=196821 RepID=UPI00146320B8|nr:MULTISPECIES: hypothetical protein [unclassified Pseudomonas]QJI41073.1 hypothetical protein HKK53_09115 [Pseudomonas sp. ADAK7]QJI47378.1 hypothetical protein HKK52_09120 [Pseudomonas sp. ADAK2]
MPDFVFNHSSTQPPFGNIQDVIPILATMLKAMATLEAHFPERPNFRLRDNPWQIEIANAANVSQSLGEAVELLFRSNYVDEGSYFVDLALMTPSWDQLDEAVIETITNLDELLEHPEIPDTHLLAAEAGEEALVCAVTGSVLTSLCRNPAHSVSQIGFICNGKTYKFDHTSNSLASSSISERFTRDAFAQLSARNFPQRKGEIFPNLLFGLETDDQILNFPSNFIKLLFTRLKDLDSLSQHWQTHNTMPENCMTFQNESEFTMNKYGYQRNRKGYDGEPRIFELHVWVGSGTRIHLFKHDELKKIEIGYMGLHLDTKLF